MKAMLLGALAASTFLSPTAQASISVDRTSASVPQNDAAYQRRSNNDARRGYGHERHNDGPRNEGPRNTDDNRRNRGGWRQPQEPVEPRDDRNSGDHHWDDRYNNGFDRDRGTWDRNDRGHDDRYGNGWNRDEGRWNDRRDDRRDGWRDNRRGDDRGGWRRQDRDDYRWDNGWRNDRRYDWRGHRNQYRDHYRRPGHYYAPDRYYRYSRFGIGITIGAGFYHQNYWVNDPDYYRLPPVYGPYRWVRYYDDVLLVDVRNGYVVDAVYDFFW
jgi:hypothetical protein